MAATIGLEQQITVGKKICLDSASPSTRFAVVFEDDGDTGYFYGLDSSPKDQQVLDALHIYNVRSVTDKHKPSLIRILWSADGLKAALLVNDVPHAVFDFSAQRGWCRTGFPPPRICWSSEGHAWDDTAMELFE